MKNLLIGLLILISLNSISQTVTTVTKYCGKCGKQVSSSAKVGDKCPYCGAVWGSENKTVQTTSSPYLYAKSYNQYSSKNDSSSKSEKWVDKSNATKNETIDWILSKLKLYTPKNYFVPSIIDDGSTIKDISYSFDDYYFIINYTSEHTSALKDHNNIPVSVKTTNTKFQISIPIYGIEKIYSFEQKLIITTSNATMIKNDITNSQKRVNDYFSSNFEIDAETDLINRLQNAFFHLKKFYKKPVSKELF